MERLRKAILGKKGKNLEDVDFMSGKYKQKLSSPPPLNSPIKEKGATEVTFLEKTLLSELFNLKISFQSSSIQEISSLSMPSY